MQIGHLARKHRPSKDKKTPKLLELIGENLKHPNAPESRKPDCRNEINKK